MLNFGDVHSISISQCVDCNSASARVLSKQNGRLVVSMEGFFVSSYSLWYHLKAVPESFINKGLGNGMCNCLWYNKIFMYFHVFSKSKRTLIWLHVSINEVENSKQLRHVTYLHLSCWQFSVNISYIMNCPRAAKLLNTVVSELVAAKKTEYTVIILQESSISINSFTNEKQPTTHPPKKTAHTQNLFASKLHQLSFHICVFYFPI